MNCNSHLWCGVYCMVTRFHLNWSKNVLRFFLRSEAQKTFKNEGWSENFSFRLKGKIYSSFPSPPFSHVYAEIISFDGEKLKNAINWVFLVAEILLEVYERSPDALQNASSKRLKRELRLLTINTPESTKNTTAAATRVAHCCVDSRIRHPSRWNRVCTPGQL